MTDLITSYLIRKRWVNLSLEHAKAATFCFRYLTSKPFLRDSNDDQILLFAKQGYYGFQDYSVQYCLDHFLKCVGLSPTDTTQPMLSASKSARDFLDAFSLPTGLRGSECGSSQDEIIGFVKRLPSNSRDRDQYFDIADRTVTIRRQIEEIRNKALTNEELDTVNNLYGFETKFKCPKIWCNHFTAGFQSKTERTRHLNCHERPYCCPEEGCFASHFGFDAPEKLSQHTTRHHPDNNAELRFPKSSGKKKLSKQPEVSKQEISRQQEIRLSQAAAEGDEVAVLACLDSGVDPNARPEYGVDSNFQYVSGGPLRMAAENGHFEVCKQLLERGAKLVEERDRLSGITTAPLYAALRRGQHDIIRLFLCQPELGTSRARRRLPGWITAACQHDSTDVLKLLFESPISRYINVQNFHAHARRSLLNTCLSKHSVETLRVLLEHGFSELVTPDIFFLVESRDQEAFVDLLRPIIDKTHPPYSLQRAESLLSYLGVGSSYLEDGQMATLQKLSPDEQRRTAKEYKKLKGIHRAKDGWYRST